uniref:Uncharacterized protein n=1 Tax=Daphnia galeata TaxID=27404 RepID=A0A8J2RGV7_9CRUS|nr:unnamed protein product [Daphnia galeata]
MFQRKSNFPQMPTPPTGEQQAKDMMKCTNNSDVVQALDLQDRECSFNAETNICLQKLYDLLMYKRNLDNSIQDLNTIFPALIRISNELQNKSDNVKLQAYQSIN